MSEENYCFEKHTCETIYIIYWENMKVGLKKRSVGKPKALARLPIYLTMIMNDNEFTVKYTIKLALPCPAELVYSIMGDLSVKYS